MLALGKPTHHKRVVVWVVLILAVFGCAVVGAYVYQTVRGQGRVSAPALKQLARPVVTIESVSSRVLFTGNTFWGRNTEDWSMASPLKYAYPFSRLKEFHRDTYDAWISGLECPMKASVHMTAAEQEKNLQFNCSPKFLPEAKKWFTAFSLANNHTDNQGVDGFEETQTHLEEHGIQYFGHYDPKVLTDVCDVISLPVTVRYSDASEKVGALPVALCGFHGVFEIPPQEAVDRIKQYAKVMPVFALPHMGAEYKPAPDQIKTDFYHSLIDAGADAVLGDHPHWVQSTESYKGHLIVYSMGNFMFDQQFNPEVTRSAAIAVELNVTTDKEDSLEAWLAIGKSCTTYHDDCLARIDKQGLKKLQTEYGFKAIGTTDHGQLTKPATPSEQQAILDRLEWQATMDRLQPPYASL